MVYLKILEVNKKMNKKTYIVLLSIVSILVISTINVSAYDGSITITDGTSDVKKTDDEGNQWENYRYDNIDIKELKCVQTSKKVEITLKLNETGVIEDSFSAFYLIALITTGIDGAFMMVYNSDILGEFGGTDPILIFDGQGDLISPTSFSGVDTNTLSVSFNLKSSNERVISIGASAFKTTETGTSNFTYTDSAPDFFDEASFGMNIYPDAGGFYEVNVSETFQLSGTLEEGSPSDYDWIWVIDNTSIELIGQNPTHIFKTKDTYTGRLYVYDGEGNWGLDTFELSVKGTSTNGGNNNEQPGFELIFFILAAAIALLIFRKKKK